MLLICLVFCVVLLVGFVLFISLVFCVVFGGVRVVYMFTFLCCVFGGVRVARSLVFSVVFCRSLFVFLPPFLLTIVVSVLLLFTHSDYPFGIFELFV